MEGLIAAVVLALLLGVGMVLWRSAFSQERALARYNSFQVKVGTFLEALKQDLRSVRTLSVTERRIDLVRVTGFSDAGDLIEEAVSVRPTPTGIAISRGRQERVVDFAPELKLASAVIDVRFKLHQLVQELDVHKGSVSCTVSFTDRQGQAMKGFVASATVRVEARELTQ